MTMATPGMTRKGRHCDGAATFFWICDFLTWAMTLLFTVRFTVFSVGGLLIFRVGRTPGCTMATEPVKWPGWRCRALPSFDVSGGIPDILRWVVRLDAAVNAPLTWLIDTGHHVHLALTALLSVFKGLVIVMFAVMMPPR